MSTQPDEALEALSGCVVCLVSATKAGEEQAVILVLVRSDHPSTPTAVTASTREL